MGGRIVEFGGIAVFLAGLAGLLFVGVSSLMGWSIVHDKLRREQKEDSKETK